MTNLNNENLLIEVVSTKLGADDDPSFWEVALKLCADEFLRRYDREAKGQTWVFYRWQLCIGLDRITRAGMPQEAFPTLKAIGTPCQSWTGQFFSRIKISTGVL